MRPCAVVMDSNETGSCQAAWAAACRNKKTMAEIFFTCCEIRRPNIFCNSLQGIAAAEIYLSHFEIGSNHRKHHRWSDTLRGCSKYRKHRHPVKLFYSCVRLQQ